MKLRVVAPGHRMPPWVTAGWDDYARRMSRAFALELIEIRPEPRDRGKTLPQLLSAEAVRIAAACKDARVVALDEQGEPWTTRMLAERVTRWRHDWPRHASIWAFHCSQAPPRVSSSLRMARWAARRCRMTKANSQSPRDGPW